MFSLSAAHYDVIYESVGKNYEQEANRALAIIQAHQPRQTERSLLDVACGTGEHLKYFQKDFTVEGLDLDAGLLEAAQRKLPAVPFHHANMLDFALDRKFDVVTCLFSAIGYTVTLPRLQQAIQNMQRHIHPGGLLLVEPWFAPGQLNGARDIYAVFVDRPRLKIVRMDTKEVTETTSTIYFEYLVGTPAGVGHFKERHDLGLFTPEQYLAAFRACGMDVTYDEHGLDGRGLYIAVNS